MKILQELLTIVTPGRGMVNLSSELENIVKKSGITTGLCQLFLQHTSASLLICENSSLEVQQDLETFMARTALDADPRYKHTEEGADDMSAHIRTVLTESSLTVPIQQGKLALGQWQGIYLWEHRTSAHQRKLVVTLLG